MRSGRRHGAPVGMLFTPGYPGFPRGLAPAGPELHRHDVGRSGRPLTGPPTAKASSSQRDSISSTVSRSAPVAPSCSPNRAPAACCAAVGHRGGAGIRPGQPGRGGDRTGRRAVGGGVGSGPRSCGWPGSRDRWSTDLHWPQGILVADGQLYIVDADAKSLIAVDLAGGSRHTIAAGLPVGAAAGCESQAAAGHATVLRARRDRSPASPPAADGTLYVSADAEGSVLAFRGRADMTARRVRDHRYIQVARTLRKEIVDGVYPVGSQLPTEHELCERFSVSRYTVREALRRLREDNLVASRPRAGHDGGSAAVVRMPTSRTWCRSTTCWPSRRVRSSPSNRSRWSPSTTNWRSEPVCRSANGVACRPGSAGPTAPMPRSADRVLHQPRVRGGRPDAAERHRADLPAHRGPVRGQHRRGAPGDLRGSSVAWSWPTHSRSRRAPPRWRCSAPTRRRTARSHRSR